MAGATADRYANSGLIFLTITTVARNNKIKKKILILKYVAGELAPKLVTYITIAVTTGYSTLFSSLVYGHAFLSKPRFSYKAGRSL
jgi:hypothetical protein